MPPGILPGDMTTCIQSWRGIKKTGNLSGPLFLAILAGAASFLKPHGGDGGCKSCNVELYYNINIYIALSAEVPGETARSGANQPDGAATGGAEGYT